MDNLDVLNRPRVMWEMPQQMRLTTPPHFNGSLSLTPPIFLMFKAMGLDPV